MKTSENRILGLLGYPLGHSFSPAYFRQKFQKAGLVGWEYRLLEMEKPDGLPGLIGKEPGWLGFNVTIPHKQTILPYLGSLDVSARRTGAVNVVKILPDGSLRGFNTDYYGFLHSLLQFLPFHCWEGKTALIFGNGGAAKAVAAVLDDLGVFFQLVTRREAEGLAYDSLSASRMAESSLLVNCTPVGMHPASGQMLPVPLMGFSEGQFVIDLIYNPEQTRFLEAAASAGAHCLNGLPMLYAQADKAWSIWTQDMF